jgi:hypothetical protein
VANVLYPKGKEHLSKAEVPLLTGNIRVYLVDSAVYTYNAAHQSVADVPAGARVANGLLGTKTVDLGVFDAADTTLPAVSGAVSEALIIALDSGTEATSWLLAYIDSAIGLPVAPTGGDIVIQWDSGANRIWAL